MRELVRVGPLVAVVILFLVCGIGLWQRSDSQRRRRELAMNGPQLYDIFQKLERDQRRGSSGAGTVSTGFRLFVDKLRRRR